MKKWEIQVLPWSFEVAAANETEAETAALQYLRDHDGQLSEHLAIEEAEIAMKEKADERSGD